MNDVAAKSGGEAQDRSPRNTGLAGRSKRLAFLHFLDAAFPFSNHFDTGYSCDGFGNDFKFNDEKVAAMWAIFEEHMHP